MEAWISTALNPLAVSCRGLSVAKCDHPTQQSPASNGRSPFFEPMLQRNQFQVAIASTDDPVQLNWGAAVRGAIAHLLIPCLENIGDRF